jgi:putative MATE family efflux protein
MTDATAEFQELGDQRFLSTARLKTIFMLALPILAALLTQNLMGVIDTGMIGQLGDTALAAISIAGNQFFTLFSLLMGISAGVQMMVARRIGEGREQSTPFILNAGLLLGALIGLLLLVVGYTVLPFVIDAVSPDPQVADSGKRYLFTVLPSALFGGLAIAFGGFWIGASKPMVSLAVVVVQLFCNAFFNYLLIFGNLGLPAMGVAGAGLGTSIANGIGLLLHALMAFHFVGKRGFLKGLPEKAQIKTLLTVSIPMSIQQFLFALGMMIFVFIVGVLGTKELAAFQVIIVIMMTSLMMAMGLGSTATTLVGVALGKGDADSARRWGWEVSTLGGAIIWLIGITFFVFAKPILAVFIADPSTADLAVTPLRIMTISLWIEAFGRILSMSLVGAGAVGTVFKISFINQWFLRLPLYWLIGIYLEFNLVGIFVTMLFMYILQSILFVKVWKRGNWSNIKL